MSIIYPLNAELPYKICYVDHADICSVTGIGKCLQTKEGYEFGSFRGIWKVHMRQLFTKRQRRQLAWVKRNLGEHAECRQYNMLRAMLIDKHKPIIYG